MVDRLPKLVTPANLRIPVGESLERSSTNERTQFCCRIFDLR